MNEAFSLMIEMKFPANESVKYTEKWKVCKTMEERGVKKKNQPFLQEAYQGLLRSTWEGGQGCIFEEG